MHTLFYYMHTLFSYMYTYLSCGTSLTITCSWLDVVT